MKLIELEKDKYESFVKTNKYKSHFLQSSSWGELCKEKRGLKPYFLGLVEKDKVLAATLLLKKSLPLGLCYLYSPRGFVLDFNDFKILDKFTEEIVKFAKKEKAIYLKIDPDIIWKKENYLGEVTLEEAKEQKIFKELKRLGYKHLGFTKNFETMQPRYTFRIDLNQDLETIKSHFSKTTKQRIQKSLKLQTEVEIGTEKDLPTFYHLMMLTESRKDFVSYKLDYYKTLYKLFNEKDKATLFLGKVNLDKTLKVLKNDLKEVNEKIAKLPTENLSKSNKNQLKELERQKEELANLQHAKEVTEHRINRNENRIRSALKKQNSARTHRLIVEEAELEYVFEGIEDLPQNTFWAFMKELVKLPGVMELYGRVKSPDYQPPEGGEA